MRRSAFLLLVIVAVAASSLVATRSAVAQLPECGAQQQQLLHWSYPPKNGVDVSVNTAIVAIPSRDTPVKVSLDGTPLVPRKPTGVDRFIYSPGTLAAGQTFTLVFELGDGATTKKIQSKFTTRDPDNPGDEKVVVGAVNTRTAAQQGACAELLAAQGCWDYTPAAWVTAEVSGTGVAYVVTANDEAQIWPAECLAEAFTASGAEADASFCFEVSALGETGTISASTQVCPFSTPEAEPTSSGRRGGSTCSASPAAESGAAMLCFLALLGMFAVRNGVGRP